VSPWGRLWEKLGKKIYGIAWKNLGNKKAPSF